MRTLDTYIFEKLKINKSTKIESDVDDTVDKFFKCCGLKPYAYLELGKIIEEWLKKNSIKELTSYITTRDYRAYFTSDTESLKYFDKVDSPKQLNISRDIMRYGKYLYKDEESGFKVIGNNKGLIFTDEAQWAGMSVFYDKSDSEWG